MSRERSGIFPVQEEPVTVTWNLDSFVDVSFSWTRCYRFSMSQLLRHKRIVCLDVDRTCPCFGPATRNFVQLTINVKGLLVFTTLTSLAGALLTMWKRTCPCKQLFEGGTPFRTLLSPIIPWPSYYIHGYQPHYRSWYDPHVEAIRRWSTCAVGAKQT